MLLGLWCTKLYEVGVLQETQKDHPPKSHRALPIWVQHIHPYTCPKHLTALWYSRPACRSPVPKLFDHFWLPFKCLASFWLHVGCFGQSFCSFFDCCSEFEAGQPKHNAECQSPDALNEFTYKFACGSLIFKIAKEVSA